jgi:hypothetical protein
MIASNPEKDCVKLLNPRLTSMSSTTIAPRPQSGKGLIRLEANVSLAIEAVMEEIDPERDQSLAAAAAACWSPKRTTVGPGAGCRRGCRCSFPVPVRLVRDADQFAAPDSFQSLQNEARRDAVSAPRLDEGAGVETTGKNPMARSQRRRRSIH